MQDFPLVCTCNAKRGFGVFFTLKYRLTYNYFNSVIKAERG